MRRWSWLRQRGDSYKFREKQILVRGDQQKNQENKKIKNIVLKYNIIDHRKYWFNNDFSLTISTSNNYWFFITEHGDTPAKL